MKLPEAFIGLALSQLKERKAVAKQSEKVDNASLLAGSPMYFYCKECEVLVDVLPEDYLFPPGHYCSQCQGLKELNLI